jgi:transposase
MSSDNSIVIKFLSKFKLNIRHVVYEAGPTGFSLQRELSAAGFSAGIIAPGLIPRPSTRSSKTDSIDCRKLAEYASKQLLAPIGVPTEKQQDDREIIRHRKIARKNLTQTMNRIKSFLLKHNIDEPKGLKHWSNTSVEILEKLLLKKPLRFTLDMLLDDYHHNRNQIAKFDSEIRRLSKLKRHNATFDRLCEIPGVGQLTAMTMILELFSPARFKNERQIGKYMGLSPRLIQSGETSRSGGLTFSGNRHLRGILIEAAWRWIRKDKFGLAYYSKLLGNTGKPQKAIVATARKLGIIMHAMLVSGKNYIPDKFRPQISAKISVELERQTVTAGGK